MLAELRKPSLLERMLEPVALQRAWAAVAANGGAPGGDEVSLTRFQHRLELNLLKLANQVRDGSYRLGRVRHVTITERGKRRRLTILSVADRVLQRAALGVLQPRFERAFLSSSFGYRPTLGVDDAVRELMRLRDAGLEHVLEVDVADCFGNIDHAILLTWCARGFLMSACCSCSTGGSQPTRGSAMAVRSASHSARSSLLCSATRTCTPSTVP